VSALAGRDHLQLLRGLARLRASAFECRAGISERIFAHRHAGGGVFEPHRESLLTLLGHRLRLVTAIERLARQALAVARSISLKRERAESLPQLGLRIDDETDFALEPCHLGLGRIVVALGTMDVVAGLIVGRPQGLELRLDRALGAALRFDLVDRFGDQPGNPRLLGQRLVAAHQPEHVLFGFALGIERPVLARHLTLAFELVDLGTEFAQDVVDARQIFAGIGEPTFSFAAALLVARHARRFFEEDPQLFGFGLDDPGHGALADDGVGTRTEPSAQKHVMDVFAPNRLIVDEVAGLPVAGQHPLDRDLGIGSPRATQS
jgi:hypothetical protein